MKTTFTLTKKILILGLLIFNLNNAIAQTAINIDKAWITTPKEVNKVDDVKIIFDKTQITNYKIYYVNSMYHREEELKKTDDGAKSYVTITKDILSKQKDALSIIIRDNQDKVVKEFNISFSKENSTSATTNNATQEIKTITLDEPTGYAFEDAKLLQEAIQKKNKNKIIEILNKYDIKIDIKKPIDFNDNEFFNQNESLKSVLILTDKEINDINAQVGGGSSVKMLLSKSIGGLDVTKYANAIAAIMIEHAKEELTVAFFNKFQKFIKENEEFRVLFPKTSEKLEGLLSYKYTEMIEALREAFHEDIRQITLRIDDVLALPRYKVLSIKYPEITIAIRSLHLVTQLETGTLNASGVLQEMANFNQWEANTNLKNIGGTIKVANLINESISHMDSGVLKWHDAKVLLSLYNDNDLFRLYLGLLFEKSKIEKINFKKPDGTTISFSAMLVNQNDNLFFFQNKIQEFVDLTAKVQIVASEIDTKNKSDITNDDRFKYISTSIDMIEYSFSIYNFFDEKSIVSDEYVAILRLSNSIYKNIYKEQYNAALSNTFDLFEKISNLRDINDKINEDKSKDLFNFAQKAKPYALFMANMVEAKTEADVKATFDAVILPVGSSSIKKHSDFNFNIQSYLGARYSFTAPKNNTQSTWNDRVAISAPIGLSISYGLDNNWGSISLFAPLLDLGAIVDYKLEYENEGTPNETLESKDYTIELGQIFSPGAYIVYGIGANIPLSVGIGGQYGPGLSKINEDNSTQVDNPYWKWNIFLSVDIPLFNFVNHPKFKK